MDPESDTTIGLSCADALVVATQISIRKSHGPCFVEACWIEMEKKFEVIIMIDLLAKGAKKMLSCVLAIEWCSLLLVS